MITEELGQIWKYSSQTGTIEIFDFICFNNKIKKYTNQYT